MKMTELNPAWCVVKIRICALAAAIGLFAFTNAPAGTIGGTTTKWNSWSEAASMPTTE